MELPQQGLALAQRSVVVRELLGDLHEPDESAMKPSQLAWGLLGLTIWVAVDLLEWWQARQNARVHRT